MVLFYANCLSQTSTSIKICLIEVEVDVEVASLVKILIGYFSSSILS